MESIAAGAGLLALLVLGADQPPSPDAMHPGGSRSVSVPADTASLATGPYSRMTTLLEKTLFQVNVAELTLRHDSSTAAELRRIVEGREYSDALADSVAAAVLAADRVHGRLGFRRDVELDRFLESVRSSMEAARDAGILEDSAYRSFRAELRGWYAALEGRGVREGDVTEYRVRRDTLRVIYRSDAGEVLIDRTDVGEPHRNAVLGGYLAPGGDFREGLVRSLFRRGSGDS